MSDFRDEAKKITSDQRLIDEFDALHRSEVERIITGKPNHFIAYTHKEDNFGTGYARAVEDIRCRANGDGEE